MSYALSRPQSPNPSLCTDLSLGHIPGNCMHVAADMHACGMACRVYKRKGESERANKIEFVVSINKVS